MGATHETPAARLALPPGLQALMRCPACRSALSFAADEAQCTSAPCARSYPVIRGTPVLIDEARSVLSLASFRKAPPPTRKPLWKVIARRLVPRLEANPSGRANLVAFRERVLRAHPAPVVLNYGGKHAGSFSAVLAAAPVQCIEANMTYNPLANVIADAHALPLPDASVDAVALDAVLEHMVDPVAVAGEIHRVLKPGGLVYADTPFMVQVHGGAFDFMRFSHLAHRRLFRHFEEIDSGVSCGPGSALAVSVQYFLLSFASGALSRGLVRAFCGLTLFWLKYFDYWLCRRPAALDAALGFYFVGRKSDHVLSDRELVARYGGLFAPMFPLPPAPASAAD